MENAQTSLASKSATDHTRTIKIFQTYIYAMLNLEIKYDKPAYSGTPTMYLAELRMMEFRYNTTHQKVKTDVVEFSRLLTA